MARVKVRIEWPTDVGSLPDHARARLTVEDVTALDGPSIVLAETVLDDLDPAQPMEAEIEVEDDAIDPRSDVIVRVHVSPADRRSRDVESGDLVSVESHPVLTAGHGDSVVVHPRRVGR